MMQATMPPAAMAAMVLTLRGRGASLVRRACRSPMHLATPFPSAKVRSPPLTLPLHLSVTRDTAAPSSGFYSNGFTGTAAAKAVAIKLSKTEKASFLHRHHLKVNLFHSQRKFAHVNMTFDGKHATPEQAHAAQRWRHLVNRDARRTARLVQQIWRDARKVNALPDRVVARLKSLGLQHERMATTDDSTLLI